MFKAHPRGCFSILAFGSAVAGVVVLVRFLPSLNVVWAWLIALNAITFLIYGYDKAIAGKGPTRVPEMVLLGLVLFGGTLGAIIGRVFFDHKTKKESFRVKFWLVVLLQVGLLAGLYMWGGPEIFARLLYKLDVLSPAQWSTAP